MNSDKPPKDSLLVTWGIYGAAGFQLALSVVLGLLGGGWVDKKLNSAPWFALAGLMLGGVSGFYNLIRLMKRKEK